MKILVKHCLIFLLGSDKNHNVTTRAYDAHDDDHRNCIEAPHYFLVSTFRFGVKGYHWHGRVSVPGVAETSFKEASID